MGSQNPSKTPLELYFKEVLAQPLTEQAQILG